MFTSYRVIPRKRIVRVLPKTSPAMRPGPTAEVETKKITKIIDSLHPATSVPNVLAVHLRMTRYVTARIVIKNSAHHIYMVRPHEKKIWRMAATLAWFSGKNSFARFVVNRVLRTPLANSRLFFSSSSPLCLEYDARAKYDAKLDCLPFLFSKKE